MEEAESRLRIRIERRGVRRYVCSGCGRRTGRVRSIRDRTWDDLPWAAHHVTLIYSQRRIVCRHCGIRTERIEFADPKARVTRRLRQQIGVDCQSMPTSHAAVRYGVSWGEVDRTALLAANRHPPLGRLHSDVSRMADVSTGAPIVRSVVVDCAQGVGSGGRGAT